jgi:hypothetical protein
MVKAFTSERCFKWSPADQAHTEFGGLKWWFVAQADLPKLFNKKLNGRLTFKMGWPCETGHQDMVN